MVGEWIEKSYGVSYSRSALIKLLQRNDMEYRGVGIEHDRGPLEPRRDLREQLKSFASQRGF
jgi:hypothetical protein